MESGKLQRSDTRTQEREGRFGRINDMVISSSLQDYDGLDQKLEAFYRTEYLNRQLFRLK